MIDQFVGPLTKSQRAFEAWHLEEWEYEHRMCRRGFTFIKKTDCSYWWEHEQLRWQAWQQAIKFKESDCGY